MTWDLRLGDCLDPIAGLASLADKSIDVVITDPPYSAKLYTRTRTNKGRGSRSNNGLSCHNAGPIRRAQEMADGRIGAIDDILDPVAQELMRVAKRWIVVFHNAEISDLWRESFGASYVRAGVWVKSNPMPQVTGDRPAHGFESITIAHRVGRKRWNGGGRAAVWTGATIAGEKHPDHPCPKPIWLMQALVRDFTEPGELVLDPFAGSGTTGVAAIRDGRRFVGWERDPQYHAMALRRLSGAREQLDMFGRHEAALQKEGTP